MNRIKHALLLCFLLVFFISLIKCAKYFSLRWSASAEKVTTSTENWRQLSVPLHAPEIKTHFVAE